jgi:hypothetical protein
MSALEISALSVAILGVLALAACSAAADADEVPSGTGGMIEMAISQP